MKENGFTPKHARSRQYSAETVTNADSAVDPVLLAIITTAEVARNIGLFVK